MAERAANVTRKQAKQLLGLRSEAEDMQVRSQNDYRDVHAREYVVQLVAEPGQLRISLLQLFVQRDQLFVSGLELLLGRLQLLVGAVKLLHAGLGFFVRRF